jgi:alanine dehydrogenase
MGTVIGIRREDKNEWERRTPLVPADVADLVRDRGLEFIVQPSPIRVHADEDFAAAGASVDEDLSAADVVLAVKEIPVAGIHPRKTYVFFSHTVKGQAYNMPMLQHVLDVGATLIDYERISDEQNRRLIFFSVHAGYAGMIESLRALGLRQAHLGRPAPLAEVRHAFQYPSLAAAEAHLAEIGERMAAAAAGSQDPPLVIGIAGYGNVARGCRHILEALPVREITPAELPDLAGRPAAETGPILAVVFREEHMVEPRSADAQFVLQDYYQRPQNYRGVFERHLPFLDVLMNTIYWEERYPRLVTRKWVKEAWHGGAEPRLQVIGDISCDIDGSIEITRKAPPPDNPCYVYDPAGGDLHDGVEGRGPVVMSVDNLPCELPRESSAHFSAVLRDMVPALARADFTRDLASLDLPPHLKKAVIAHRGELAPAYGYLKEFLDRNGR